MISKTYYRQLLYHTIIQTTNIINEKMLLLSQIPAYQATRYILQETEPVRNALEIERCPYYNSTKSNTTTPFHQYDKYNKCAMKQFSDHNHSSLGSLVKSKEQQQRCFLDIWHDTCERIGGERDTIWIYQTYLISKSHHHCS